MSLTKKDKEEIKLLIAETLDIIQSGREKLNQDNKSFEIEQQIKEWNENAIETGLGLRVAPADFKLGDKEYFTWDEAKEIEEKYLKPKGWRLPTVNEFVMLYGKYGIDGAGDDDVEGFRDKLKMELRGYRDSDDHLYNQGTYGLWWSTSANSSTSACNLLMFSSVLYPQGSGSKVYGLTLRCVSPDSFPEQSMEENQ